MLKILVEGRIVALGEEVIATRENDGVGGKMPVVKLLVKVQYVA